MEEIKVGEYVRYIASFKNNNINKPIVKIGKILNLNNYWIELDTFKGGVYNTKDFKNIIIGKPSNSIIDLIEVGDYVNEERVIKKNCHLLYWDDDEREEIDIDDGIQLEKGWIYFEEDIENIVTKEEFKSVMYEVK